MKREHVDEIVEELENITDDCINEIPWVGELVPRKVSFSIAIDGSHYKITVEDDDGL